MWKFREVTVYQVSYFNKCSIFDMTFILLYHTVHTQGVRMNSCVYRPL